MCKFLKRLFGKAEAPKKKPVNVSVDGLSAQKNVLQTIRNRTGATYKQIRWVLYGNGRCWMCHYRKGDKQTYYDQKVRNLMIAECVEKLGTRK